MHLAKVNRPYGHIAIRRREKKTKKHVRARGMKQKTKRASGVRLAVQLPSHPTPMPKPPGSILVGDALLVSFLTSAYCYVPILSGLLTLPCAQILPGSLG